LESLRTLKIAVSVLSAFQQAQRSDHLGSSNVSYRADGQQTITQRYYPWGTIRPGPNNALPTDYTFTGQKLDESTGLMYYGARYYDPALSRFIGADPIVPEPGNPQALNRYSYVYNNPLRYTDPTGQWPLPPIVRKVREMISHPYVKPLWQNPLVGAAVGYSLYRQAKAAIRGGYVPEALVLTTDWYFELGEEPREYGLESEITQFLITDRGVQAAREEYVQGGGEDLTGEDIYEYKFDWEYFTETPQAMFEDEWSGSFLGGYWVEIKNLEWLEDDNNLVEITVMNDTGWASGSRIPFTDWYFWDDEPRGAPGPGGTLWQYYRWTEIIRVPQ